MRETNVPFLEVIDEQGNKTPVDVMAIDTGGGGGSGTFDHNELINRDIANQHPISAIGGLTEALANKQPVDDYALRNELPFTVHIERDGKNYSADYSNLQIKEFINSGGSVNANLDGFIYPLWLSGGTIIFSLKEPLVSFPQMSDTQIMLTDNKISEGKYKAIVNQHTQRVVKSSDFESLKTEVEAKADKTYVDTLIGNLSTVIDSINGTIGGETA